MRKLFYILPFLVSSCIEPDELGRISYQVEDTTLLPLTVLIDGKIVDSIQTVGNWDCEHTDEYIFVGAPSYKQVVITGNNYSDTFEVFVETESCTLIEIE